MKIHVLGICGTFMGGVALLAREQGHPVAGTDAGAYPPMSSLLQERGIPVLEGYREANLVPRPDLVVIGNALSRGNPCVEYVLDEAVPFTSGPQWLAESVLRGRQVLAVSGTHGKTTTSALLAWILEAAGRSPGFLIGGVAENFGLSARLGDPGGPFVVEADEYDTAFFDKRSKFVHYRPKVLIINNIEFDHADIFSDLAAIRRQFHHLVRTVPHSGGILVRHGDAEIQRVLEMGCWTPVEDFGLSGGEWQASPLEADFSSFRVSRHGESAGTVRWGLFGRHNAENALAAIAAAARAGVAPAEACRHAGGFLSTRRRLQRLGSPGGVAIYDDFAHHPTAIRETLAALRARVGESRIIAVLEPRSNTMKLGIHREQLAGALADAALVFLYRPADLDWDLAGSVASLGPRCRVMGSVAEIVAAVRESARGGDTVLVMSNGGFENIQRRLLEVLA